MIYPDVYLSAKLPLIMMDIIITKKKGNPSYCFFLYFMFDLFTESTNIEKLIVCESLAGNKNI